MTSYLELKIKELNHNNVTKHQTLTPKVSLRAEYEQ